MNENKNFIFLLLVGMYCIVTFIYFVDFTNLKNPTTIISYIAICCVITILACVMSGIVNINKKYKDEIRNWKVLDSKISDLMINNHKILNSNQEILKEFNESVQCLEELEARIIAYSLRTKSKIYHEIFEDIIESKKEKKNS